MKQLQPYCDVGVARDARAAVVSVAGEVDLLSAPRLADALADAGRTGGPVVVDLSACTFIDSSGLNALLGADVATRGTGRHMVLACRPEGAASRLLALTVPGHFAEHPTRASALAAI